MKPPSSYGMHILYFLIGVLVFGPKSILTSKNELRRQLLPENSVPIRKKRNGELGVKIERGGEFFGTSIFFFRDFFLAEFDKRIFGNKSQRLTYTRQNPIPLLEYSVF